MPIAFTAAGTLGGVSGADLNNPTSLQFGPDGRLYVSEQNGSVNAYTVEKQGDTWVMTAGEQLADANGNELVKNIQNHNDDGSEASTGNRQVTGIVVAGTADEPVLYISSSDPRISSNNDTGLDTNSGTVTRASFNSTTGDWEVIDLVRGLPRSEENHSVNGMLLSEDGTKLLLNVGGFTNNGAPSGFFSYTNEYALSGATLELDLVALDALPTLTDPEGGQNNTPRDYKYDLPTLDDPNIENVTDGVGEDEFGMDENGPHGGNDGLNMAILPADAPLRLYAEGTRNDYDLARGENGLIYTVDNGSNGNLGGAPNTENGDDDGDGVSGEAIATPNNGGQGEGEPFHQLVEGGYYYHPNPVRSNQNMEWTVYDNSGNPDGSVSVNTVSNISDLVPDGVNIADGFLIDPTKFATGPGETLQDLIDADALNGTNTAEERLFLSGLFINSNDLDGNPDPDGSGSGQPTIAQLGSSTNGIIVYDSGGTAFGGTIDGAVFVTQFNDNLTLLNVNDTGTDLDPIFDEGPDGIFGTADDEVQDADGILQVANAGTGASLGNPLDVTQGPNGTLWVAEIGSNEITVLEPTNVLDPTNEDADFDGIPNVDDPFSRDATNGTSVTITAAEATVWEFSQGADDTTPGPDGFGGGLTGAMINGVTDFEAFYLEEDPDAANEGDLRLDNVKFVTAASGGTTTIEKVSNGDPFATENDGEYLFHTGFVLDQAVDTFTTTWVVSNPGAIVGGSDITAPFQQIGGYLGDGTQSNYLKIVALQKSGGPVIQIALEEAVSQGGFPETFEDQVLQTIELPAPGIFDAGALVQDSAITLELLVDLTAKTATPQATYQTTSGPVTITGGQGDVIDLAPGGVDSKVLTTFNGGTAIADGEEQGIAAGLFSSNTGSTSDTFQAVFDSITVSATEADVAPVAVDDDVTTQVDTAITIPVAQLVANDTDANSGDVLTITGVGNPSSGSVVLNAGVVTYTPDTGFEGDATFDYTVEDSTGLTDTGSVTVSVSDLTVLFRLNAAGDTIAALPNDPYGSDLDWEGLGTGTGTAPSGTQSGFDWSVTNTNTSVHNISGRDADVPDYVPQGIYAVERWDPGAAPDMQWTFGNGDLPNGTYTVNILAGNGFGGTSEPGTRVFDIEIEGELAENNLDLSDRFGHQTGGFLSYQVQVTDGTLNVELGRDGTDSVENPTINGIEILQGAVTPQLPTIDILGGDQTVGEDAGTAFISIATSETVTASGGLSFTYVIEGVSATPEIDYTPDESLSGAGTATFTGTATIAPSSSDFQIPIDILQDTDIEPNETFTVTITSVGPGYEIGNGTATVTIEDDDTVTASGEVLYRINTGGQQIVVGAEDATNPADPDLDWDGDTGNIGDAGNSPNLVSTSTGTSTYNNDAASSYAGDADASDPSIPAGTPADILNTERYDPTDDATALVYQFDVAADHGLAAGDALIVRLYFAEIFTGIDAAGQRVFDVAVNGAVPSVFDDVDPFGTAGANVGFMLEAEAVVDAAGLLTIEFAHGIENPAIKGIEILAADGSVYTPPLDDLFGTAVELSNSGLAPTDAGTLSDGDNIMSATQEGEGDGANGVRDRDYFTVDIPQGKILTGIFLDAYDVTNPTAPDGFFAFQEGPQVITDPLTGDNVNDLTGAIIYGEGDIGTNLLETMRGGFDDSATGNSLPAFDQELTGELTFWLNQGAGPNTPTLRFVVDDAPTPPAADVYLPNANGDFVFEAESAEDAEPGNWVFNQTSDLPAGHDVPSGDAYVLATSNHLSNASGEELVYKFQPTESGFIQINLVAAFTGSSATDENDSYTGVFQNGAALTPLPQQGEALAGTDGNAIGGQGFYKTYSSGGNELDFILANKTWDNNAVPIIYEVTAGETYEFILKERSSGHKVDKIALMFSETEPSGIPGNNQAAIYQSFPVSPQTAPGAVISGRAFADGNDNAIDDGEPGIEGVTVELLDLNGNVIETTTTAADGSYSFDNLPDGSYSVLFPTALATDPLVAADQGGNDAVDSDADQTTGATAQVAVVAGDVETDVDAGYDREVTLVGAAVLTVNDGANGIETSNFGDGSFEITNTGQKQISAIEIDVTDALFPDAVFDPFDLAGDTTGKHLVIDSEGNTGVVIPLGGTNFDNPALEGITYFGAGGSAGYEKIRIEFNDFQPGETLGFSIDMDPNSIAGALKSTLDSGAPLAGAGNWDVGGIAGGELVGSLFTVEYDDASVSSGKLQGQGTGAQMGASALSTQAPAGLDVTLTVNGLSEGAEGTYGDGGPQILIQGPDGETARVLVSKGFIVPFTNEFTNAYAATLDAQIQALEASGFPANNAVEMLYVDVPLDGTVQDISGLFDFTQVAGFDLSVPDATNEYGILEEGKLPLGIVASVIDPATDLPKGNVTSPIHLQHSDSVADIALTPVNAELVESGDTGTSTLIEVNAQVQTGAEGTFEAVLTVNGTEVATQEVTFVAGANAFSFQVPNDNLDDGTDIATVTLRETGGGAPVPSTPAVFSITEDDGPVVGATLLRINAFGPELVATDSGPNWLADTEGAPISYFSSGDGTANFNRGDVIAPGDLSLDPDLPAATPSQLFELTRSSDGPILYSIPVTDIPAASGEYQVNLYFAEGFYDPGARVFDVQIEGAVPSNLDNVDVSALFGLNTGGVLSTDVEVTDGELNIEFLTGALSGAGGVQNPIISGIEIIELVDEVDPVADLSLEQTVSDSNPDFGDTITFTLTVTNDGPDEATGVDVENLLPSGFGFEASTASIGSYDDTTGLWDVGTLASGASATLTVDVTVLEASPTPDEVLFRVNNGGPLITATDGPDWSADTTAANSVYLVNAGSNNNSAFPVTPGATVPASVPDNIFDTERWDNTNDEAGEMQWEFPVAAGFYDVRLFMGNGFGGTSDPGQRVFDVQIEGATPTNLDDLDLSAVYGHQVGAMVSNIVEVTDGTLDIDFIHDIAENPLVNGIEIIKLGDAGPALDYANYAEVLASDQSDPDSTPGDESTGDDDDTTLTVSPVAGGLNSVTIVANDAAAAEGTPTDPAQFTVEIEEAAATETTVTYSLSGAATNGVDYQTLTGTVSIAAGDLSAPIDLTVIDDLEIEGDEDVVVTLTDVSGDANLALGTEIEATAVIADDDVANEVAITVAQDASEPNVDGAFTVALAQAATTATEIAYTVTGSATSGSDFEPLSGTVTIAAGDLSAPIDVAVLDDGVAEGAEDIVVTLDAVTAGNANIQLGAQTEAVMTLDDDEVLPINGSATLEITPGGALGSSTFGGTTAFQINNTGATSDAKITAVSLNLATGILPDMVFDPIGSGGDETAQVFSPNAASATATGLVAPADPAIDPFSQARNGGFDVISMEFTDFDPGESFSFSVDIDPNNIQGVSGAGAAGAVSGYELIGSTVTLTFDDGTTQEVATSSLFEDGSLGGAQSVSQTALTTGTVLAAPTVTLDGPGVDASANLPGQQTYVAEGDVDQTVLVTGTPGATVSLLQMDARLYIASGDAPFDVQPDEAPFYANEAMAGKVVHSAVLDANGEAMIPVTLLETPSGDTTPDGGLNHFVAVLSDGPYTPGQPISQTSNTLVVTQAPTVDVSIAALADGAEGGANGQFEVTLAQPSTVDTVVSYEVNASSTATAGSDYTALSGTVTIPAGDTSATIDVSVLDDPDVEVDETVVIDLTEVTASNGLAVIGAQNSATGSITSDDVAATEADLSLTKTVSDATPAFSDTVTFTIEVVNDGPGAAGGITVEDLLGDGFGFVGATASVGTFDNSTGLWTLGSLASGDTASLTIEATVEEATPTPDQVIYRIDAGADSVTVIGDLDSIDPSDPDFPNDTPDGSLNGNATTPPGSKTFAPGVTLTGGQEFGAEGDTLQIDGVATPIDLSLLPTDTVLTEKMFLTERFGVPLRPQLTEQPKMEWDFNVENGDYTVNLYFAEIFIGIDGRNPTGGGNPDAARQFDVEVEGALVLDDYSIFADVGAATAVLKSFDATVTDGNLDIDLTTVVDNAKISAIEIIKTGDAGAPLDYSTSAEILTSDVADPDSTPGNGLVGEDDDASLTLTPSATDGNDAPVITSADSFEFVETATGPVFTATATDADLDPVTFSLGTGGDEANFAIDETTGEVTLTTPPAFEIDGEIDTLAETVQELSITVEASDATETTSQVVTVEYLKDTDTDGVADRGDNAIFVENPDQRDSDGDGYGNIIDADLNNDEFGFVDLDDLFLFRQDFGSFGPVPGPSDGFDADFDGNGSVDLDDLFFFRDQFGQSIDGSSFIDLA